MGENPYGSGKVVGTSSPPYFVGAYENVHRNFDYCRN